MHSFQRVGFNITKYDVIMIHGMIKSPTVGSMLDLLEAVSQANDFENKIVKYISYYKYTYILYNYHLSVIVSVINRKLVTQRSRTCKWKRSKKHFYNKNCLTYEKFVPHSARTLLSEYSLIFETHLLNFN